MRVLGNDDDYVMMKDQYILQFVNNGYLNELAAAQWGEWTQWSSAVWKRFKLKWNICVYNMVLIELLVNMFVVMRI